MGLRPAGPQDLQTPRLCPLPTDDPLLPGLNSQRGSGTSGMGVVLGQVAVGRNQWG